MAVVDVTGGELLGEDPRRSRGRDQDLSGEGARDVGGSTIQYGSVVSAGGVGVRLSLGRSREVVEV